MCANNMAGSEDQNMEVDTPATSQTSTRTPWATMQTEAAVSPWTQVQTQTESNGNHVTLPVFPSPVGLTPESIPDFPFYTPEDEPQQQPEPASQPPLATSAPPRSAIRPLPGMGTRNPSHQAPPQPAAVTERPQLAQMPSVGTSTTSRLNSGPVNSDKLATGYLDPLETLFPEPRTIAETGINQGVISDLVLKAMFFTSYMSGQDISSTLRLPFYGVLDVVISLLKKEQLCEVSGTVGLGEAGYQYVLTVKGMERAHQVLLRSGYLGPAPVPIQRYIDIIKVQTSKKPTINREMVEHAVRGMIISNELIDQIGAAANAGKSLFLFGSPGNGKTLIAERIAAMMGGYVAIPYALEADGQVIQLFDLNSHIPVSATGKESEPERAEFSDRRWLRVQSPVVVVGGELTMPSLDLIYNEAAGFYEAPFQLKANGGLFLIDDFGRQQVSPQALLNRWIVPLEKGIDYLTLKTGKKLLVPFELFLVLSTNLQPEDLVDDAFLRRIQNKLNIPDPSAQQFYEIFVAQSKTMNVLFDQQGYDYLVSKYYMEPGRPFRASQPRDLLRQMIGIARYRNVAPELSRGLIDAACSTYFVTPKKKDA